MSFEACKHFEKMGEGVELETLETTAGCFECLKTGDTWVNLRQCMMCGLVRCCDSSPNKHATAHYKSTGHGVIYLLDNGVKWCYVDETLDREI